MFHFQMGCTVVARSDAAAQSILAKPRPASRSNRRLQLLFPNPTSLHTPRNDATRAHASQSCEVGPRRDCSTSVRPATAQSPQQLLQTAATFYRVFVSILSQMRFLSHAHRRKRLLHPNDFLSPALDVTQHPAWSGQLYAVCQLWGTTTQDLQWLTFTMAQADKSNTRLLSGQPPSP